MEIEYKRKRTLNHRAERAYGYRSNLLMMDIKYDFKGVEEKRNTLKEQLIIKLGAVSSRLEEQLTNASLEKLNVLTRNIFDITSEEDVLRIIH